MIRQKDIFYSFIFALLIQASATMAMVDSGDNVFVLGEY